MTLQNGLIYRGKAYLWTDTALFDPSGQRVGAVSKAFHGRMWPSALTCVRAPFHMGLGCHRLDLISDFARHRLQPALHVPSMPPCDRRQRA